MADLMERFNLNSKRVIKTALEDAESRGHGELTPLHILHAIVNTDKDVQKVLTLSGVDPYAVFGIVEMYLRKMPHFSGMKLSTAPKFVEFINEVRTLISDGDIKPRNLLTALLHNKGVVSYAVRQAKLNKSAIVRAMAEIAVDPTDNGEGAKLSDSLPANKTPVTAGSDPLSKYTRDLKVEATLHKDFGLIIGRDGEMRRVIQALARRQKNSPILVGDVGVGKKTIVNAIAARIHSGDVPEPLRHRHVRQLDIGLFLAGTRGKPEVEERLRSIVRYINTDAPNTVLFIDDIHTYLGAGYIDILRPALSRGELQLIGTTTPLEFKKAFDADKNLSKLFADVDCAEPDVDFATSILRGISARYEGYHNITISDSAVVAAVRFAKRYLGSRKLPDSAVDLIDEAAALARLSVDSGPIELDQLSRKKDELNSQLLALAGQTEGHVETLRGKLNKSLAEVDAKLIPLANTWNIQRELLKEAREAGEHLKQLTAMNIDKNGAEFRAAVEADNRAKTALASQTLLLNPTVTDANVAQVLEQWTGVPVSKMLESETAKLNKMESIIGVQVRGQEQAVSTISKIIRKARVGIRNMRKPIGGFLCLGPTGVGKTELAKALARFLFDDENALIRMDMSEFQEKHTVSRLIGSPPGYQGSEAGGMLTEAVKKKPYSVVLFDEVEKAHPDVFDLLLQVLDDGRLTDSRGELADFSNTVVLMTSNIGAHKILDAVERGISEDELKAEVNTEVLKKFRPEFLNRLTAQIVFNRLTLDALKGIMDNQVKGLNRMLEDHGLALELTTEAKDKITELGYEPKYGARPLQRVITNLIETPLSDELLKGEFKRGDTIVFSYAGETFSFSKKVK